MKFKTLTCIVCLLLINVCSSTNTITNANNAFSSHLKKPTGKYKVGFQDFHWVNKNICPDLNYDKKNKSDFSYNNKQFCHEMMVRIYYPTTTKEKPSTPYYKPLVNSIQNDLAKIPNITKKYLHELDQLKSFSVKNAPITLNKKFPVIFFSPGLGSPVEIYENFILELVSHGYIVVGVNTSFISGDIELPNRHIIKFNPDASLNEILKLTSSDFSYSYKKIHSLSKLHPLFSAMDLKHIGALGQSLGGEIVANTVHTHPNWFQAAATLDSGIDKNDDTLKKFSIPFMREISASRMYEKPLIPSTFQLGKNGFLVVISPHKQIHDFSYHMNFTDYSTLQYLPAQQIALAYYKKQKMKSLFGTGDGWEITNSINIYLLEFFNTYLKGKQNFSFNNCRPLAKNTYIKCDAVKIDKQQPTNTR